MIKLSKYKKRLFSNRTNLFFSIFFSVLLFMGIGYGVLTSNLSIIGNIVVEEYDEPKIFNIMKKLNKSDSCITKYEGQVSSQVGQTVTSNNVYFNKCADKRNIIFNNICWQILRTTETGGVKVIYNGEVVNGKCESTRGTHKGIVGRDGMYQSMNSYYLYGSSFTYDTTNSTFTLVDTFTSRWSDISYESLLGKYTCMSATGTCTTLYNVNSYYSNNAAYVSSYTIGDVDYAEIGTSSFNSNHFSLAMVGYMFNKVYNYTNSAPTSGSLMGNDVSYSNGTYTLLPASGESSLGTTKDDTHHYTCNNTTGTCSKVRYYYYNNYYIELDGGVNIEGAVNNMLYDDNVNRYDSSIKGVIDSWYAQNLSTKTNMLEDTIYCNARNITSFGGWNKDGRSDSYVYFKNHNNTNDLSCPNVTDQFSISNNKAKLTYPVALATYEELYTLTNNNDSAYYNYLTKTGDYWWQLSPDRYDFDGSEIRSVISGSVNNIGIVHSKAGVRPVVALASGTIKSGGDGSESSPWIVE